MYFRGTTMMPRIVDKIAGDSGHGLAHCCPKQFIRPIVWWALVPAWNAATMQPLAIERELDDIVQPAEQFMHDWMHCIFVSGVWNICFEMVLQALRSAGIKDVYDTLADYIKLWCWPRRVNNS